MTLPDHDRATATATECAEPEMMDSVDSWVSEDDPFRPDKDAAMAAASFAAAHRSRSPTTLHYYDTAKATESAAPEIMDSVESSASDDDPFRPETDTTTTAASFTTATFTTASFTAAPRPQSLIALSDHHTAPASLASDHSSFRPEVDAAKTLFHRLQFYIAPPDHHTPTASNNKPSHAEQSTESITKWKSLTEPVQPILNMLTKVHYRGKPLQPPPNNQYKANWNDLKDGEEKMTWLVMQLFLEKSPLIWEILHDITDENGGKLEIRREYERKRWIRGGKYTFYDLKRDPKQVRQPLALLFFLFGQEADATNDGRECTRCARINSQGPATKCLVVTDEQHLKGACTNCYWVASGDKCSFRLEREVHKISETEAQFYKEVLMDRANWDVLPLTQLERLKRQVVEEKEIRVDERHGKKKKSRK